MKCDDVAALTESRHMIKKGRHLKSGRVGGKSLNWGIRLRTLEERRSIRKRSREKKKNVEGEGRGSTEELPLWRKIIKRELPHQRRELD